jgi:hypothetical protein
VGELLKQTGKWEEQAVELDRKVGAGFQILTSKKRRLASNFEKGGGLCFCHPLPLTKLRKSGFFSMKIHVVI